MWQMNGYEQRLAGILFASLWAKVVAVEYDGSSNVRTNRFSSRDTGRRQRYTILAALAARPRQASSGAGRRAFHDSADCGAAEAAGGPGKDLDHHQRVPGSRDR